VIGTCKKPLFALIWNDSDYIDYDNYEDYDEYGEYAEYKVDTEREEELIREMEFLEEKLYDLEAKNEKMEMRRRYHQ